MLAIRPLAQPRVGMVDAIGACSSRRIGNYLVTPAPIASATLREGRNALAVDVQTGGRAYRIPTQQKDFSNDATIVFVGP